MILFSLFALSHPASSLSSLVGLTGGLFRASCSPDRSLHFSSRAVPCRGSNFPGAPPAAAAARRSKGTGTSRSM
uniref:Putative secreted protein n=1 Tax=Anopheles marajoara TaxID=58244 RepID=A0A2M4CDG2_9DIPT